MFAREIFRDSKPAFLNGSEQLKLTTRDIVPACERTLSGVKCTFVNRESDFDLKDREAWIFISIKNRLFNRAYVNWFIQMCEENGLVGHICRVDDPYRYNRMAELGATNLPDDEVEKIERLSGDIGRMVQKALNGSRTTSVDMVRWRDIADETPQELHDELRQAFNSKGKVYTALAQHVSNVKPIESEEQLASYAEFFLCEVPILFHAYYRNKSTLDIYPGSQPEFFWQIEMGDFADELPLLTAISRRSRSMLYLDTISKPGAKDGNSNA